MQKRIKLDTFMHKQNTDEVDEFDRLEELGIAKSEDYPKPIQVLKATTLNLDSIAFIQEIEDTRSAIILKSGIFLLTPMLYEDLDELIAQKYDTK